MSWNNQGGPWGGGGGGGQGGGQSPWSRGPGAAASRPTSRKCCGAAGSHEKLVPGGMGPGKVGALIVGVAAAVAGERPLPGPAAEARRPVGVRQVRRRADRDRPALELAGADRQRADPQRLAAQTGGDRLPCGNLSQHQQLRR